jgi:hypothetical protein
MWGGPGNRVLIRRLAPVVGLIWIQMLRTSFTNTHYITTYPSSVHYCVIYLEIKPSKARAFWFSIQSGPYCFGERERDTYGFTWVK